MTKGMLCYLVFAVLEQPNGDPVEFEKAKILRNLWRSNAAGFLAGIPLYGFMNDRLLGGLRGSKSLKVGSLIPGEAIPTILAKEDRYAHLIQLWKAKNYVEFYSSFGLAGGDLEMFLENRGRMN